MACFLPLFNVCPTVDYSIRSMKRFSLIIFLFAFWVSSFSQDVPKAHNGFWLPVKDTIRIFMVFAEVLNDPYDTYEIPATGLWQRGELPQNADEYFDPFIDERNPPQGYLTKYFYQASFGEYVVVGDYYPELVQIDFNDVRGGLGDKEILQYLNDLPEEDIITKNGFSLNNGDFDRWSDLGKVGEPRRVESDSLFDMVLIMYRFNSRLRQKPMSSGSVGPGFSNLQVKGMKGVAMMSRFVNHNSQAQNIIRHEYAHGLFGGNNFHTQGGAGNRMFMDVPGGYGMLSESDRSATTWNAWDRHRLNWRGPGKEFLISGFDGKGNEVNCDLQVGDNLPEGLIYLRDFISTGDALRIELPHIDSTKAKQYLWLENRQKLEGNIDVGRNQQTGIYAFIQVGKDDPNKFDEPSNYIRGLQANGNFDFGYTDDPNKRLILYPSKENAFTGYNMLGRHPLNRSGVKGANTETILVAGEWFMPDAVEQNGLVISEDFFNYKTFPLFGTAFDAFQIGDEIHISENPAPTPLLTWNSAGKNSSGALPAKKPRDYELREIPLNGISISIEEETGEGWIGIKIKWDDWEVDGNNRWCGPLALVDTLIISKGSIVRIEQGTSAQHTQSQDLQRNGDQLFAETSYLKLKKGSVLILEKKARLILKEGSELIEESGSQIVKMKKARILVKRF